MVQHGIRIRAIVRGGMPRRLVASISVLVTMFALLSCSFSGNDATSRELTIPQGGTIEQSHQAESSSEQIAQVDQNSEHPPTPSELPPSTGIVYIYGEAHAEKEQYDFVFERWYEHYHNDEMRHYFMEAGYSTAEMLNIWMLEESDEILNQLYQAWIGTLDYNPYIRDFLKMIKSECPETIFHGTDIEHQYSSVGAEYLSYLRRNGLGDSEHATLARRANDQAVRYYQTGDDEIRENMMVENFIHAFDKLIDQDIMGVYGFNHVRLGVLGTSPGLSVPNMANQLVERYGDALISVDLTYSIPNGDTEATIITIGNREYSVSHLGDQRLYGNRNSSHREFWLIEDAYNDFLSYPTNGNVLPFDNFPVEIEVGQVFFVILHKKDGSSEKYYFRSDGLVWNGRPSTEEVIVE